MKFSFSWSAVSNLKNRIANLDTKFETGTKTALLQPFSPIVVAADENERIRQASLLSIILLYNVILTWVYQHDMPSLVIYLPHSLMP